MKVQFRTTNSLWFVLRASQAVGSVRLCLQATQICWQEVLTSKHWKLIRWISHKRKVAVARRPATSNVAEGCDVSPESPARWNACLTFWLWHSRTVSGRQSDIMIVLEWKQFDIAREKNEEMRLMLWGEWVVGGMRERKSVEGCMVGVLCWNGTRGSTPCKRDCLLFKEGEPPTQAPLPGGAGEKWGQFNPRKTLLEETIT